MSRKREDALFSAHAILAALQSSIRVLRWGMAALVVVYLTSGIAVVKPSDVGLIVRFGRVLPNIHQPGLLFAFPNPIDRVVMVPVKTVQEIVLNDWASTQPTGAGNEPAFINPISNPSTLTGDANIIQASFTLRYQVSDPIAYAFSVKVRDSLCKSIAYDAVCQTLAGMTVDDVLTTKRGFVAQQSLVRAQNEMDRLAIGIHLLAFETREINPPPQVLPAFQDVVSARVEAQTLIEPAKTNRAMAIPAAKSKAFSIQQKAHAEAQKSVAIANGRSASFLAILKEFRAEPKLVEERLYTETISAALPLVRVSMVVPSDSGQTRLLLAPPTDRRSAGPPGLAPGSSSMKGGNKDASPVFPSDEPPIPPPAAD